MLSCRVQWELLSPAAPVGRWSPTVTSTVCPVLEMVQGTILATLMTLMGLVQGTVVDLGALATWRLSCAGRNISVEAAVPGGVYSTLRQVTLHINPENLDQDTLLFFLKCMASS